MTIGGVPAGKEKKIVLTDKSCENTPDTVKAYREIGEGKQSGSGRVHWQIKPRRIVKFEDCAVPADRQVFESLQDTGRNITTENGRQAGTSGCNIFQL